MRSHRLFAILVTACAAMLILVLVGFRFFILAKVSFPTLLQFGFSTLVALVFLAVGALVWLYARDRWVARVLFGFSFSMTVVFATQTAPQSDQFLDALTAVSSVLAILLLSILVLLFPRNLLSWRAPLGADSTDAGERFHAPGRVLPPGMRCLYGYLGILAITCFLLIVRAIFTYALAVPLPVWLDLVANIYFVVGLIGIVCSIVVSYRSSPAPRTRQQIRFFVRGGLLAFAPFFLLTLLPETLNVPPQFIVDGQISTITCCLFPLAFGYTVLRYQILVFDRSVRRCVAWLVGSVALAIAAYVVIAVSGLFLSGALYASCVAFASILLVSGIRRFIPGVTERLFFKETLRYRRYFEDPDLLAQETLDLASLGALLCQALVHALDIPAVVLMILDDETGSYQLLPPLSTEGEDARLLLVRRLLHAIKESEGHVLRADLTAGCGDDGIAQGQAFIARLAASERPLTLREAFQPDFGHAQGPLTPFISAASWQHDANNPLLVPIRANGSVIGQLVLEERGTGLYAGPDFEVIRFVLSRFATLLENARMSIRAERHAALLRSLAEANSRLESLATTDLLTGLPNHRALQALLEQENERALRSGRPVSVLFFDGDRFKQVNDAYGHATGDVVLRELGERARSVLRAGDTIGRFGGEEFLVILPEAGESEAQIVAERLRSAVAASPLATREVEGGIGVTVSIGQASYPADGATVSEVQQQADQAMYWAKRLGRNQVRTAVEATRAERDASLKAATAHALERQEIVALDGSDPESRVRAQQLGLIYSLMAALDLREPGMSAHAHEVSDLVAGMARELQLDATFTLRAATAAFLHDIGKIALPDRLLQLPRHHFSEQEWGLLQQHAEIGATIVEASSWLSDLMPAIRHHHEHWDGSGTPDGLRGEVIPLEARLIALAEAYHAMVSARPYRAARMAASALDELERCAGTQFDPALVSVLRTVLKSQQVEGAVAWAN